MSQAGGSGLLCHSAWFQEQLRMLLAAAGAVTGASGRNWAAYGGDIALPADFSATHQALLSDPQTSGSLLVSCAPGAVAVLAVFLRHGFAQAAVVGGVREGTAGQLVVR